MRRFYRHFLAPGDLCFDIGANMGNRTRVFEGLGAKVIALEPQSRCFNSLVKEFGSMQGITILKKAVGSNPGSAEIMESDANTISSMSKDWIGKVKSSGRFKDHKWSEPRQVEVVTLDQLIGQYGLPSFCKIDVEGYEDQVIGGLSKKIPALSFEFTPEFLEPAIGCILHLSRISDYEFNYSLGESMKLSLGVWVDGERVVDILKVLPKEVFGDVYARIAGPVRMGI